jgi:hypothetical protein
MEGLEEEVWSLQALNGRKPMLLILKLLFVDQETTACFDGAASR